MGQFVGGVSLVILHFFLVKFIMSPLLFSVNFRGLEDVATVINTSKPTTKSGAKKLNEYSLLDRTCTKVLYLLLV